MVALDEITDALRREAELAHRVRLEELVEAVRKTLEEPSSANEKVAQIKALLAAQDYRAQEQARQREPGGPSSSSGDGSRREGCSI